MSSLIAAKSQPASFRLLVLSDIHFAEAEERSRIDYEFRTIPSPLLRLAVRWYRRHVWLRDPFGQNPLLDEVLSRPEEPDLVVANGDYTVDTAFVGVSDRAAMASAEACLGKLRQRYGGRLRAIMGDHELGKMSMVGGCGGLRWASLVGARESLGLETGWKVEWGRYALVGVTSSLLALSVFRPEALPEEWSAWVDARERHREEVRGMFSTVRADQRVILFCHDPTALPMLAEEAEVRKRLPQIERTVIGHLHSGLILWQSRLLSGLPRIRFLGNTIRRLSTALHEARAWRPFRVTLCPALAGIELLKDGGYLRGTLLEHGEESARFRVVRVPRCAAGRG